MTSSHVTNAAIQPIIPIDAVWSYLDDGSDQGTAWQATAFDDAAWATGPAELGYGDGGEATVVSFGPQNNNKYPTTYFRHTFSIADPAVYTNLILNVQRDDGVIVYLNGNEIFRDNITTDPADYLTFADSAIANNQESSLLTANIDSSLLNTGNNVVAAEIHQNNSTSSDISFALSLDGEDTSGPGNIPPTVSIDTPTEGTTLTDPAEVIIDATASDSDGSVDLVEFFANGIKLGEDSTSPYSFTWSSPSPGNYALTAVATDNQSATTTSATVNITLQGTAPTSLVALGSSWNYLDDGSDQGTAWQANAFDDSAWANGLAELGYGDGDEVTVVSFGPDANNKFPTTYFRHTFNVPDPSIYTFLEGQVTFDDGAVVYLNGAEIFRINMNDPITFASYAIGASDYLPEPFTANSSLLLTGENVVAVEVHQGNGTSSDISFDFELLGNTDTIINNPPVVSIASPSEGATFSAPATIGITASAFDPDSGGSVALVEFFEGGSKIGEDTGAPFTFNWTGVSIGSYQLTVVATDNLGDSATSSPVNISVAPANAPTVQSVNPAPGNINSLNQITVTFSEPVQGVTADSLIINGSPATLVSGSGAVYTFTAPPVMEGTVYVGWNGTVNIADFENPPQPLNPFGGGATWQYSLTDSVAPTVIKLAPAAGAIVQELDRIKVTFSEPVIGLNASDLVINGLPATDIDGSGDGPYTFDFPQPSNGNVNVNWAGGHGIVDQSAAANAFAGGSWSYNLDTNAVFNGQIVINEIMYNPSSAQPEEEFIELLNLGASPVNLVGWEFTRGISFVFPNATIPANGYLVVAADVAAFNSKYPSVGNVVGGWIGRLSNGHEDIELEDASGNRVDLVDYADGGDFATRTDLGGLGLDWVSNADGLGSSLELRNPALSNNQGQNWGASPTPQGTPGAANGLADSDIPPMVLDVTHFPVIPSSSDTVTVIARILDESTNGLTVQLWHRDHTTTSPPNFSSTTMTDDGLSNDGAAGDGIYGAILPAMGNGTIMEFYVEAEDPGSQTRTWPAPVMDGGPVQSANALYQVDDEVYSGTQPIYRLVSYPDDISSLLAGNEDGRVRNITFISVNGPDVDLRYVGGLRRRGASSVNSTPPTMKLTLPTDNTWNGKSSMNLNSVNTYAQVLGSALSLKAGLPTGFARAVQVRFNGSNQSRSDAQMYGSYAHVEVLDGDWAEDHYPLDGDGNVYSKRRGGGTDCDERLLYLGADIQSYINCGYDKESNAGENDWTDLMNLLFAVDDATTPANDYVQAMELNANVELWLRYFAVIYLMNYNETAIGTVANDDYDLYRGVVDPRFMILAHDFDSIFGSDGNASTDIFQATETDNVDRFLFHPEFQPRYYDEFRFQIANAFAEENLNSLIDQVLGDWVPAGTIASLKANAANRRSSALSQLPPTPAEVQASISGEPDSPTYFNSATITIGGNDITSYRYRLNDGSFSTETPVGTPISLSGLADGLYTVFVIGRNSSGDWQADADATPSKTWAVLSGLRGVVINEVLARNDAAVNHEGTFPDVIELFNAGNSTIDLSGKRLTDNLDNPNKYVFPFGASLPSGNYLPLYANNPDGTSGIHLGFTLAAEGETLYLLDTDANGAKVLDSIKFGLQLADLSVGRLPNGQWGLTTPSIGSANVATATGNPSTLKINEWLTDPAPPFFDDFFEIYNPDPLPVAMGGLYFTDNPIGDPFKHRITPLSFVPGQRYQVFIADSNKSAGADHVDFFLSKEEGEIGLLREDGSIIDCVIYGPQQAGISQGLSPNGGSVVVFFDLPTPGAGNPAVEGPLPPITINVVPIDQTWSYDESNTDLGTAWREIGYDDSGWPSGPALLGQESSTLAEPIRTPVTAPGSGGPVATYYRTHFNYDTSLDVSGLEVRFLIDDGAVFFINGTEVNRFNVPGGELTVNDTASGSHEASNYETFSLSLGSLVNGDNLFAVEVHQQSTSSSDTVFGLELNAIILTNNPASAGVVINEILANNASLDEADGSNPDWVEFYNPSNQAVDLADRSLTDDPANFQRWVFPAGSVVPATGYLRIFFDAGSPVSAINTGFGLKASGDSVYLFDSLANGAALLDAVTFGIQAPDWPLGRLPDGDVNITLVQPTPNAVNLGTTLGDIYQLKVNEWMADPDSGDDWFEIYNPNAQPVDIGGLHLTDDLNDRLQYLIPNRSYITAGFRGFQEFKADNNVDAGADHVNFRLGAGGDSLGISDSAGNLIDGLTFGPQLTGVSEGSLPDGSANVVAFATTASPGNSNFLLIDDVVINETLTHSDVPFEDAIELRNLSGTPVDISGWFLSDARTEPKKFRIPNGTTLAANGFVVFYENEFNPNPGGSLSFSLSSAKGDEIFLSAAETDGTLTGYKRVVDFGPSANGVSFGRYPTSVGVDFTAMSLRTFGADNAETLEEFRSGNGLPNSLPLVGPIVINEIMYHPPDIGGTIDNTRDEYIELHNISSSTVSLFDVNFPTNSWRLRDAVKFNFPLNVSIPGGEHILVVSFDPDVDTTLLNEFRSTYGLDPSVPVYGPFSGKLDNSSDSVELYKPDPPQMAPSPDAGLVPYVLADLVVYTDLPPWDTTPDGLGNSLQRITSSQYGNDPINWTGDIPTPGASNSGSSGNARPTLDPIGSKTVIEGNNLSFTATASDTDIPAQNLTFSLDPGAPSGASINPNSGVFSWTPTESQGPSGYSITIRVTDDGVPSQSAAETISVTVNEDNQPPTLVAIGNLIIDEGQELFFSANAVDLDEPAQTLTFSLDPGAPDGASINPSSGDFSWTPTESQGPDDYLVTVRVTDNAGNPMSDSETITITVNEINSAPTTTTVADQNIDAGNLLQLTIPANDTDIPAQSLSFSLDLGAPAGSSVNPSSGLFQWTPNESQSPSTNSIGIRIVDNGSPSLSVTNVFRVVVNEVNQPPSIDPITDRTVEELTLVSFTATGEDLDIPAQTLSFTLESGAPSGANIDSSSGEFTWTPTESQGPSTNNITVRLSDDGSPALSETTSFTIIVNEVNQNPVLAAIGDQSVIGGDTLTFTASATDDDEPAQTLTYSLDPGGLNGASINPSSGVFSWTPSPGQTPSTNILTVRVTDNGNPALDDAETIRITVSDSPITTLLMDLDQVWSYDQSGADLGTAWIDPAYDDSTWPSGPGTLGQETATLIFPIQTALVAPGSGGPVTTYLRTHFNLPANPSGISLTSSNLIDDGMIIYLNGVEAARFNMNDGAAAYTDFSATPHEATVVEIVPLDASALVTGDNVLAVEVHQQSGSSSDIVFALALEAVVPPQTSISISSQPASLTVNEGDPASFTVTVTGSTPSFQWFKDGSAIPGANSDTYSIASALTSDAGNYTVTASNLVSSVTSSTATLTVNPVVNTPPQFISITKNNNTITLVWESIPGRAYRLQYKTDLEDPTWNNLGGVINANAATTSSTDSINTNTKRFYRVFLIE